MKFSKIGQDGKERLEERREGKCMSNLLGNHRVKKHVWQFMVVSTRGGGQPLALIGLSGELPMSSVRH